jgi:uncharacterized protein (TIGR00288 family)
MSDQLALFIDFENIAIWAEQQFFDLELDRLMEYLQSRGPVVVKRAYGDWGRFSRYRDDLLNNSVDLIQLYSVRAGKNRADIRLALDAFEITINRPQIGTIVIVSGDSDFGALASKVREYGRHILGIGPRDVTHALLVKSCDEFVYLETVLGQEPETLDGTAPDRENARKLLQGALAAHGTRGELPVLATRLKDTMLSMDPTFNEVNLGYGQFRTWLEDNDDLAKLFFRELQMYVTPVGFEMPQEFTVAPRSQAERDKKPSLQTSLAVSYSGIFSKVGATDVATRRDVLRDIYRELSERPGEWTLGALLDELQSRYASKGLIRSKTLLRKIMQLGFHQRAYEYLGNVSVNTPVRLAEDIESQAAFIRRAESQFVYSTVKSDVGIDQAELATALLNDPASTGYVQELLDDLEHRGRIVRDSGQYRLVGRSEIPLLDDRNLQAVIRELRAIQIPEDIDRDVETAMRLAKSGMAKRSHDFAASAQDFLIACRLQLDALERQDPDATLEDLRWYVASYVSVRAGDLSQNLSEFAAAQPYYLAFFSLVQEDTPLWGRVRQLINPMLHFYWRNIAREMSVDLPYTKSPAVLAVQMATYVDAKLRTKWKEATERLAQINPAVLQRVANQIRLTQTEVPRAIQVAEQIDSIVEIDDDA